VALALGQLLGTSSAIQSRQGSWWARVRERTDRPHQPAHHRRTERSWSSSGAGIKGKSVFNTIAFVLVVLWLVGLATAHTLGGLIHVLLVVALVIVLLRIIGARKAA
jgi:Flp pilus assembly protein TadB